jgi:protein TonB
MPGVRQEPALDLELARTGRFAAPRVRLFVPSAGWGGRRRRELLLGAGLVAVLFHVAMVAAIVEAPALVPAFLRTPPPKEPPPPPEAELVMVKQDTPTVGGTPPPQKVPPPAPKAEPEKAQAGGGPASTLHAPDGPAVPPPADSRAMTPGHADAGQATQPTPPPAPPASTMQVNLDLDGQPGWGLVDQRTIAASPDDHYINKPAAYPRAAAERGEEGTVYLLTLIAPDGHPEVVRIEQSSGYPDLDRAARNAIAKWHFRPAIRGGVPVESEMREVYHFNLIR